MRLLTQWLDVLLKEGLIQSYRVTTDLDNERAEVLCNPTPQMVVVKFSITPNGAIVEDTPGEYV